MSFTSISFIFLFLPISLFIYYICPVKFRAYVLSFLSLAFYAFCSLDCIVYFVIQLVATIVIGYLLTISHHKFKKILLIVGILLNSVPLVFFKILQSSSIVSALHMNKFTSAIIQPLGLSFFTFKAISFLVDTYKNRISSPVRPVYVFLYLSIFSQISSGPISRYSEFDFVNAQKTNAFFQTDLFCEGVFRFLTGFSKKILLADILFKIVDEVFQTSPNELALSTAWLGAICFSLQLYYDFSGYSDMAIGITNMFGYSCNENFDHPYTTNSFSQFWKKWHISLSEWFRDYIYIPLGGSRNGALRTYTNLFAVWLLTGLWHGLSGNYIAWGLAYFFLISFEKLTNMPNRFSHKIPRFIYRIFVLLIINFQWVMFRSESFLSGLGFIKKMFVSTANNARAFYLLRSNYIFVIMALIFCLPVRTILIKDAQKSNKSLVIYQIAETAFIVFTFILSLSFAITGSYNPFTYSNF